MLLIEHDDFLRKQHCAFLKDEGIACQCVSSGRAALDLLKKVRPRMILLDLLMPTMNGWEFVEHLRSKPDRADIPVLVMTPFPMEKLRALEVRAEIRKPVRAENLLQVVKGLLR